MIHRAAATALPGAHERVHLHMAAADERCRQEGRDSCTAPPARHPAAPDRQASPHPAGPGVPRRPPAPATKADAAAAAPDRLPRHRPTLAPRPPTTSPCQGIPPETARPAAHRPQHPNPRPASGEGEPQLGLPANPRRAGRPRHQGRPSTVWEILQRNGVEPAPQHDRQTWAVFLRGQAHAIIAADFFETRTLAEHGCTSSPSSNTPPAAFASSAPPPTPPQPRPHNWSATWSWTSHRSAPTPAAPTDHRTGPTRPPRHPTTRSTRRHPPRVPTRRLSCTDQVSVRTAVGCGRRSRGCPVGAGRCGAGPAARRGLRGGGG